MQIKRITILVALWKAGNFIEAKIENLKRLENFEDCWIVFLNCLDLDNESKVYSKFVAENENVFAIRYKEQINLYPAWNDGIRATSSEYIMNSNVDDMLHPQYVTKCAHWLDNHQEFACVSSRVLVTHLPNQYDHTTWDFKGEMPFIRYPGSSAGPCPVWRRSLHNSYGYFGNYRVIGDARMWESWHAQGEQFGLLDERLVLYYRYNDSLEMRSDANGKSFRDIDLEEDQAKRDQI